MIATANGEITCQCRIGFEGRYLRWRQAQHTADHAHFRSPDRPLQLCAFRLWRPIKGAGCHL